MLPRTPLQLVATFAVLLGSWHLARVTMAALSWRTVRQEVLAGFTESKSRPLPLIGETRVGLFELGLLDEGRHHRLGMTVNGLRITAVNLVPVLLLPAGLLVVRWRWPRPVIVLVAGSALALVLGELPGGGLALLADAFLLGLLALAALRACCGAREPEAA